MSRGAGEPLSLPGGGGRLSPGRLLLLQCKAGWFLASVPSRFSLFLSPSRPLYFCLFTGCPTPPLPHFRPLIHPSPLTFQPPPPPTDVGPAAASGVQGTGREVGSALGQRSSLRTGEGAGDGALNPSGMWAGQALMEGAHPSPLQAAADSCHGPQYLRRAPLTQRPPDTGAAAVARSIY